ncbi:MAG: HAD-IIIA family hydrolase [Gammaproteobacteria bacterium]|nr:HAD-IIIA family hydrolase [Gammaproteobacteria bacterium]MCP5299516.1 HAD-IIIA family hydrolase [Chromatiaceae bacterium]
MTRRYDVIVFDWDGTLMDSEARIVTCMQRAALDAGLAVPDDADARDVIGLGLREAIAKLFALHADADIECVADAYRLHWLGNDVAAAAMFDGATDLLESLHEEGHLLAVATGKSRRGLDKALQDSGLAHFFHVTRCADEAFSKPHPQMLEDILTDLNASPLQAVVVGDTEYDMQMASNAGVAAVGVTHGVHSAERLLASGARKCFADLRDLHRWLRAENDPVTGSWS